MSQKVILLFSMLQVGCAYNPHIVCMCTGIRKSLKVSVFEYLPVIQYVVWNGEVKAFSELN